MRSREEGYGQDADNLEHQAKWHHHAATAVHTHGNRLASQSKVVNGEAVPRSAGYLQDTLKTPDLAAIESSETRGRLLQQNEVVALGVDLSKTIDASNTAEKLIAHQIAVAHKIAMQQAAWAMSERDPKMEIRRLQVSARMMSASQDGLLTLHKLKASAPQSVTVQHVHVHVQADGQAVVGNLQHHANGSPQD